MGNQCATAPQNAFWEVNVKSWTADHVYSWITDIDKDLKSVARILRKDGITGSKLIEMNRNQRSMEQKLKSLNISVGDRILLIKEIKKLILDNDHENTNYINNGGDTHCDTPTLDFLPTEKNPYAPNNTNNNDNANNNNNDNNNGDQSQHFHPGQPLQLNQLMKSNKININHHDSNLHQTQNRVQQNVGHSSHPAINHSMTAEFYPGDIDTTEHHQQSYIFQGYPSDDDQQGAYQFTEHLYEEDMEMDNNDDSYFRTSLKLNKLNSSNTAPTMSEKQLSSQQHQQQHQQQQQHSSNNNNNNSDLDGNSNNNMSRNYSENNVRSNRKTPSLSLRQSLSKIKDLKNTFRHNGHGGHGSNDFVILETPTPSTSSNRTPLPQLDIGKSNQWTDRKKTNLFGQFQEPGDDEEEDGDAYDDFKMNAPNAQAGPYGVPMLSLQNGSHQHPTRTRAIVNNNPYFNWRRDAGDMTNYNDIQTNPTYNIKQKGTDDYNNDNDNDDRDDSKDDDNDDGNMVFNTYSDDEPSKYFDRNNNNFEYEQDLSSESYPSAIANLTNKHTKTLFMLETTKRYLLSGYLREQDINIKKLLNGIENVITAYFDDSKMNFYIKTTDLCKSNGYNKLYGREFKFLLNMDHKIELCPTLIRKIRKGNNTNDTRDGANEYNEIELLLECEYLPIKIDKCNVLINIKCICHEIKYQKIDIYSFGTDLLGDNHDYGNYNLLNKSGLRMIIPQNDIENLNDLKFEINATVLDIEYDPNYINYGIVPTYNENLKMSDSISFEWKLTNRILKIMSNDIFKQRFYSSHFDFEHWCLSCYKHDDGQLNICLNLLRLQSNFESVDCQSIISLIVNNKQIIWTENTNLHCDIQYNNSFKWKLDKKSTNELFKIINNHDNDDNDNNISINIQIKINKRNKKQNKDIYNEWIDPDNDIEIENDNTNF